MIYRSVFLIYTTGIALTLIILYLYYDVPLIGFIFLPFLLGWIAFPAWLLKHLLNSFKGNHNYHVIARFISLLLIVFPFLVYGFTLFGKPDAQAAIVFIFAPFYQLIGCVFLYLFYIFIQKGRRVSGADLKN